MAKRIITDIVAAHAVALCRRGANPGAHVLLRKTADTPSPSSSSSEEPTMSIKSILAFHALSDVAKAHVTALAATDDKAADAFMAKTAEEQAAELEKAGKKPEPTEDEKKKAAEAAAAASAGGGATGTEGETAKSAGAITVEMLNKSIADAVTAAVAPMAEQITALKTAGVESDLRKAALAPEYQGYPGGADKVYETLKSIEGQPDALRTVVIESLKSQAEIGKRMVGFGGLHVVADGEHTAAGEIEKSVTEIMKADPKLSREEATMKALGDDKLLMKALDEEDRMAG